MTSPIPTFPPEEATDRVGVALRVVLREWRTRWLCICDDTAFLDAGRWEYAKTTLGPRYLPEQGEGYAGGDALPEVATESGGRNETDGW